MIRSATAAVAVALWLLLAGQDAAADRLTPAQLRALAIVHQESDPVSRDRLALLARWFDRAALPALDPLQGDILARFGQQYKGTKSESLRLKMTPRRRIAAPADGQVVFAGTLPGVGRLLIIDHGDGYHSVLSGFSRLEVGKGVAVAAGQGVGSLPSGQDGGAELLVEIRRQGVAVDPLPWLRARTARDERS